jgi:hypothetical protein
LALSVADPVLAPEGRADRELCRALRQQTAANRDAAQIGIDLLAVRRSGSEATATLSIRRQDGEQQVELSMRRNGDRLGGDPYARGVCWRRLPLTGREGVDSGPRT